MTRFLTLAAVMAALGVGTASANDIVVAPIYTPAPRYIATNQTVYYGGGIVAGPVAQTTYYAPAAGPVEVLPAPAVVETYRPVVITPRRVVTYSPVIAAPAPVVAAPVTTYYAPTTAYYAAPVTTYYAPAYAVPVGRPVVVRSKVYVPGQPIRNTFKAITP